MKKVITTTKTYRGRVIGIKPIYETDADAFFDGEKRVGYTIYFNGGSLEYYSPNEAMIRVGDVISFNLGVRGFAMVIKSFKNHGQKSISIKKELITK